jgi:FSR family fosmidomycin resistance protein-like MFS transporter
VEPVLGILGDVRDRRALIRGGGVAFALALLLVATSGGFTALLAAQLLLNPASGAFVSLSQATLVDLDGRDRDIDLARWALAGSLGVVAGPLLLSAAGRLGLDWRGAFAVLAALTVPLVAAIWRAPSAAAPPAGGGQPALWRAMRDGMAGALHALRRREVLRWLVLLELGDLILDVLLGFLALYFVDVVGTSSAQAALAVAVWTGVGLIGDVLIIAVLKRVSGERYLRASAMAVLVVFPTFLLVQAAPAKLALLGALGLLNSGWYSILKSRLYASMPGQSATVLAVSNVSGLAGALLPLTMGLVAEAYGLGIAMWLLLAAPVGVLIGTGDWGLGGRAHRGVRGGD